MTNDPGPTGDARVDAALQRLDGLDEVPVDEHANLLAEAHATLQEVLRDPDVPSDQGRRDPDDLTPT